MNAKYSVVCRNSLIAYVCFFVSVKDISIAVFPILLHPCKQLYDLTHTNDYKVGLNTMNGHICLH